MDQMEKLFDVGDMNGWLIDKVGVLGWYGTHEKNDSGKRIPGFSASHLLRVANTYISFF